MSAASKPTRDLCIMACIFCREPEFLDWLYSLGFGQVGVKSGRFNEAGAKAFILDICKVKSRNDLDTDEEAAKRFHALVREPYLVFRDGEAK